MPLTFRNRDSNVEQEISRYLDRYLYPTEVTDFCRYSDRADQMRGVDVTFSIDNQKHIIVDEKAATHYINKNIPTFAFELSFLISSGTRVQGWLLDPSKDTEYYMLMWVMAKKDWDIILEDITRIDCLLINRQRIIDYLSSVGYNPDELMEKDSEIRVSKMDGAIDKSPDLDYFFFSTSRLVEKPINIVIRKQKLIELAMKRFIVTPY
jgi:hypothetical protein